MDESPLLKDIEFKLRNQTSKKDNKIAFVTIPALALITAIVFSPSMPSESAFNENLKASISVSSDSIKAPTGLKVTNTVVNQTDLKWNISSSLYTTGYKILRSDNIYGPWKEIATVNGRNTVAYSDKGSGTTQWIYRVEAVWSNWISTSPGFESPPAVGREFFDTFTTPDNAVRTLDGMKTGDGKSVWQIWSGAITTGGTTGGWATGAGKPQENSMAMVKTPAHDAQLFFADFDGGERLFLRGKDPKNYIYIGGTEAARLGSPWYAAIEIGEVRDGVVKVLKSGTTTTDNRDLRVEIKGNTVKIYIDAIRDNETSGTLLMQATTSYLQTDPEATWFGLGFIKAGFGISDFTFNAY